MDVSGMGTPVPHDLMTPDTPQLRRAAAHIAASSPVQPAVTPLQMAGFDPIPERLSPTPTQCFTSYQLKNIPIFTGRDKQGPRIEDWVRDMRYLLRVKGPAAPSVLFQEVVRHTGGRARDLVLNLEGRFAGVPSAEEVFKELMEEYGELDLTVSPMAAFYARLQMPNETTTDYAIALEALLRRAVTYGAKYDENEHDAVLCTQFMHGLRDKGVRSRLAPMRPRHMTFKELRRELHIIQEENRKLRECDRPIVCEQYEAKAKKKEDNTNDLLDSLRNQLAQIQLAQKQQMETINHLLDGQAHLGNRLGSVESNMGPVQGGPPRRQGPPRCYNCGQLGHMIRGCPNRSTPQAPQAPQAPQGDLNQ